MFWFDLMENGRKHVIVVHKSWSSSLLLPSISARENWCLFSEACKMHIFMQVIMLNWNPLWENINCEAPQQSQLGTDEKQIDHYVFVCLVQFRCLPSAVPKRHC